MTTTADAPTAAEPQAAPVNFYYADLAPEDMPNLKTPWEDVIALAIELRDKRDHYTWALGDLALAACDASPGRPAKGAVDRTVSALADAIGEDRSALSAIRTNSLFYTQEMRRQMPPQIGWRAASECRTRSGWTVGTPIEQRHRDIAMRFITEKENRFDAPPPPPPPAADRLERQLQHVEKLRDDARLKSAAATNLLNDAIATTKLAIAAERRATQPAPAEPAQPVLLPIAPPDHILPIMSLADESAWQWLATVTDDRRPTCGIIVLEGEAWMAYQRAHVRALDS